MAEGSIRAIVSPTSVGLNSSVDKIASHPYFYAKDLVGRVAFAIFFSIRLFYAPNVLGHPDNYMPVNLMFILAGDIRNLRIQRHPANPKRNGKGKKGRTQGGQKKK
eukprot:c11482_g4_i1 orf=2-316(-)